MNKNRLKKAGFALWVFIHFFLLLWGYLRRQDEFSSIAGYNIYPWNYRDYDVNMSFFDEGFDYNFSKGIKQVWNYDLLEFVIYVITPIFLYYLYRYVKGEKIPFIK